MFRKMFHVDEGHIQKMLDEFSPIFIKNIIDNNIIRIIEFDMPNGKKTEKCIALLELSNRFLFGKKAKKFKPVFSEINKLNNLEKYISEIIN